MTRILLALVLVLGLAGCGFHLRNKLMLPTDTAPVKVVSTAPYSELVKLLNRSLLASGARLADEDSKEPSAQLQVLSERWGDLPIAIDSQGRAQEYSLRYAVIFIFRREDGSELVPQQVIELSRDYVSPPTDATGTTTEREILANELRREMSASIIRRIDSVVRAEIEKGGNLSAPKDKPIEGRSPQPSTEPRRMELRPEQLASQGADTALAPVYLIAGPETLRVLEAADAIRARARASGIGEREVFDADGRDFDWNQLDASINAPSLFSARRLVEVRLPSGKPGKDGAEVISQFCANPAPDVVLMITANEWSKAHQGKWAEAVNRIGVLSVAWAIKPHELPDWIERRLRGKGLRADPAAVQRLAERVEGNLLAAAQEIDKLALLADGQPLDVERMESLVADAARYDVFRLVEATFSGQPPTVLRMLAGLRGEGEAVAALMPMVIRELLTGAGLARVQARGGNLAAEMKSRGIWESRQAPYKRALQRHPESKRWERFVAEAGLVDRIAKGRADGDAWLALERLLVAVAEPRAVRLLARA